MVLPLVPVALIAIGAVTGGSGIALGGKAALDFKKASHQLSKASERYEERRSASEQAFEATNRGLRELGSQQEQCALAVVGRMTEFLRRNAQQVRERDPVIVDGIDVTMVGLPEHRGVDVPTNAIVGGVIGSAIAGAGTNAAVASTAAAIGTASTGAAISGLSGVAAENAALAWLGGGSLAAGGGGMAMGAAAMNFVTIGPALLVTGLVANGQGAKALTQARAYHAEIAITIAELDESDARFAAVDT